MPSYQQSIMNITKCSSEEAFEAEEIMREEIFHSTLDWQSPEQFRAAAIEALAILREHGYFIHARGLSERKTD